LFWNKFDQAQTTDELYNQANEHWHRRQRFIREGDGDRAREVCAEVVQLCQLSIQGNKKMGDTYVLLARALLSAASQISSYLNQEQHQFLQSRAIAVIHSWYSLPHRGYPVTKNAAIGDRLWRITVDQLMQDRALPEGDVIALMDSYRDSLSVSTVSPDSFEEIKRNMLTDVSWTETTKVIHPEQSGDINELFGEAISALDDGVHSVFESDLTFLIEELFKQHRNELNTVILSTTPERQEELLAMFLDELGYKSYAQFVRSLQICEGDVNGEQSNLLTISVGKVGTAYLIGYLWYKNLINSNDMHRYIELLGAMLAQKLCTVSIESPLNDKLLSSSLLKIALLWGTNYREL